MIAARIIIGLFFLLSLTSTLPSLAVVSNFTVTTTPASAPPSGTAVTTFTFTNYGAATLSAGSPVTFAQGFRYGDIMPGTYPLIRDATTHTALAAQQWDDISRWAENGGNGSWRHAAWAALLPRDLPVGATQTVEFVPTVGNYAATSHQPLTALCAAHDLKIHLTDVRNQNDTQRDSGEAAFRLCDNIATAGRDAPRHVRAGPVYDEYVISGLFIYTSGRADPLLYGQCTVDIFTQPDGSAGDVRYVCEPANAWMNVAANSTGNPGNPGSAGWTNDPQSISYRPEILDGTNSVLNWASFDATIQSANNPVQPSNSAGCYSGWGDALCIDIPTATGANIWYSWQATRVSCPAPSVCPAGMHDGQLYYVAPVGQISSASFASTKSSLILSPNVTYGPVRFMTASQGSGQTNFSFRVQHYHGTVIPLLDQTGLPNWAPHGSTARTTRKLYPAFSAAEKQYWEQTGLVIPLNLTQSVHNFSPQASNGNSPYYNPNAAGNVIGGTGGGDRPDLGIISEWAAQAFIVGDQPSWDYARLFTLGTTTYANGMYLNEATGRIPPLNNGPPTGPGGNGSGTPYPVLGAPMPQVSTAEGGTGLAIPPLDQPNPAYPAYFGQWTAGSYISHMPSFAGLTYMVFGDRLWLNMMRLNANRDYAQQRIGPGPELGQGYRRDNNAQFTDGNIYHYYAILYDCCQGRGYAWMIRDITYAATFGDDNDPERALFDDFLKESRNYYPMWLKFKDGPGNTNYTTSIIEPGGGGGEGVTAEPFIQTYVFDAAWLMMAFKHEPLGSMWLSKSHRFVEGNCGRKLPGALPYYCFDYYYSAAINDGADGQVTSQQGSTGLYVNGADAADFGIVPTVNLLTNGQWSVSTYTVTPGDLVMSMSGYHILGSPGPIDQLAGNRYYAISGPVTNRTFYIACTAADHVAFPAQCPVAGQAFTGFTRNGIPIQNENTDTLKLRLSYDPGVGYSSPNYMQYGGQRINALHIAGFDVTGAIREWTTRGGSYNDQLPINNWDPTVVIPGLPPAVSGLP
jgi:hypothetical protein